ncbi:unnamed protein product, partial [Allacma fusca]
MIVTFVTCDCSQPALAYCQPSNEPLQNSDIFKHEGLKTRAISKVKAFRTVNCNTKDCITLAKFLMASIDDLGASSASFGTGDRDLLSPASTESAK